MMDKIDNYTQLRWGSIDGMVYGEDCDYCEKTNQEVNYNDGYSKEK